MESNAREELADLMGSWRLISARVTYTDTNESFEPFGSNPVGYMLLEAGGRIMFVFTSADRRQPKDDADRAALFKSTVAYSGLVRLAGSGRFITHVDVSWNPEFLGDQERLFRLEADRLIVSTREERFVQYGNRPRVAEVVWVRERR